MKPKKLAVPVALVLFVSLAPLFLGRIGVIQRWELAVFDLFARELLEPETRSEHVSLVLLDTKSLDWGNEYADRYEHFEEQGYFPEDLEGPRLPGDALIWSWDRSVYDLIIQFLAEGGARAVVFDMEFTSRHHNPEGDFTLGAATQMFNEEGSTYVVHTINFNTSEKPPDETLDDPHIRACLESGGIAVDWPEDAPFRFDRSERGFYYNPILPYREISYEGLEGHLRLGAVCVQEDPDAVIRRALVLCAYKGFVFPSLGTAAALAYMESRNGKGTAKLHVTEEGIELVDETTGRTTSAPLGPSGDLLIHWKDTGFRDYEGEGRFPSYPAYRVLLSAMKNPRLIEAMTTDPEGFALDPSVFKDRIVFIGANAPALYDLKATPVAKNYPGVNVHAAVAENLLDGDAIHRLSHEMRTLIAVLLALFAISATLLLPKAYQQLCVTVGLMVAYTTVTHLVFTKAFIWIDTIAPLAGTMLAYAGGTLYRYFTEGRQKRQVIRMFQHYVPPKVVESLVANPEALNTRGQRVEISVFFSDIKGFTTISNTPRMRENPEKLTNHLNAYLSEMTRAIHDCGGTLDKYIGDAVVAFWGAPLPLENHALEACRAAIACQKRLALFNAEAEKNELPALPSRIGLFSGEAIVGNVGSLVRLSYTAIGSTMNFGARLEGVNKVYGTWILAGESTIRQAGDEIVSRYLDRIRVPGIVDEAPPLKVFQVLNLAGDDPRASPRFYRRLRPCPRGLR